jgi:hypothetical protein
MPYLNTKNPFGYNPATAHDDLIRELTRQGWTVYMSGPMGTELLKPREARPLDVIAMIVGAAAIPLVNVYVGAALMVFALIDNLVLSERNHLFISRHNEEASSVEALLKDYLES